MLFDTKRYLSTCDWLGQAIGDPACLVTECYAGSDLRGSWPYGTLPENSNFRNRDFDSALTWTGVIRPDKPLPAEVTLPQVTVRPLKPHYAHLPTKSPAHLAYSTRTRRRIRQGEHVWYVSWECMSETIATFAAEQQLRVAVDRRIPAISNPSATHFQGLQGIEESLLVVGALRRQITHELEGILILASGGPNIWHAHSSLCTPQAQYEHGGLFLWDSAIKKWSADYEIWWGGAPFNAPSVANFKRRFSNHQSVAHLVHSVLIPYADYERILDTYGRHAWLPRHIPPPEELDN